MRALGIPRSTLHKYVRSGILRREVWGHRTYRYIVRDLRNLRKGL